MRLGDIENRIKLLLKDKSDEDVDVIVTYRKDAIGGKGGVYDSLLSMNMLASNVSCACSYELNLRINPDVSRGLLHAFDHYNSEGHVSFVVYGNLNTLLDKAVEIFVENANLKIENDRLFLGRKMR